MEVVCFVSFSFCLSFWICLSCDIRFSLRDKGSLLALCIKFSEEGVLMVQLVVCCLQEQNKFFF